MEQQNSSVSGKFIGTAGNRNKTQPASANPENIKIIEVETLFLGGGPATLGILANAYQTNRLEELVRGTHSSKPGYIFNDILNPNTNYAIQGKTTVGSFIGNQSKEQHTHDILRKQNQVQTTIKKQGIAIVDVCGQFGGGNLQKHFGVKSNTSATGFLKVLMFPKSSQTKGKVTQEQITKALNANQQNQVGQYQPLRNNQDLQLANQKQFSQTSNGLNFAAKSNQKAQPIISQGQTVLDQASQLKALQQEKQRMFLPHFENFAESSEIVKSLQKYGKKVAPLQLIGTFLSYAGNAMLNDIWQRYQRKIFYGNHQAVKIKQISSIPGIEQQYQWETEVKQVGDFTGKAKNQQPTKIIFRSKNIVMATGANQLIPYNFKSAYGVKNTATMMTSDEVLKFGGFQKLVRSIKQQNGKCKIAVLGGSHSAFSVLHLLINGPCKIKLFDEFQRRQFYKSHNKTNSVVTSLNSQFDQSDARYACEDNTYNPSTFGPRPYVLNFCNNCASCPYTLTHSKMKKCLCGQSCACLSIPKVPLSLTQMNKDFDQLGLLSTQNQFPGLWPILQDEDKIQVIYRRQIKVHFSCMQQAQNDNYMDYDKKLDLSKGGIVYPFTGIRGDAKELWNRIKRGQEKHVELMRADSNDQQKQILSKADVIVVACGYHSNQLPIQDANGNDFQLTSCREIKCHQANGLGSVMGEQIDVNTYCQLMDSRNCDRPIAGLYGIGQGFSLGTNDASIQAEQRNGAKADSVGLYMKQIGNKLLSQIIPKAGAHLVTPADFGINEESNNSEPRQIFLPSKSGIALHGQSILSHSSKKNDQIMRANTTQYPKTQEHRSEKFLIAQAQQMGNQSNQPYALNPTAHFTLKDGSYPIIAANNPPFGNSQKAQGRLHSGNKTGGMRVGTGKSDGRSSIQAHALTAMSGGFNQNNKDNMVKSLPRQTYQSQHGQYQNAGGNNTQTGGPCMSYYQNYQQNVNQKQVQSMYHPQNLHFYQQQAQLGSTYPHQQSCPQAIRQMVLGPQQQQPSQSESGNTSLSPDKKMKIGSTKKNTTKKIKNFKDSNQSGYIINLNGSPLKPKGSHTEPKNSAQKQYSKNCVNSQNQSMFPNQIEKLLQHTGDSRGEKSVKIKSGKKAGAPAKKQTAKHDYFTPNDITSLLLNSGITDVSQNLSIYHQVLNQQGTPRNLPANGLDVGGPAALSAAKTRPDDLFSMGSSNVAKGVILNLDKAATNRSQSINHANIQNSAGQKAKMIEGFGDSRYNIISTNVKGVDVSGRQSRDLTAHLRDQEESNKQAFSKSGISSGFEFQASTSTAGAMKFSSTYKETPSSSIQVPSILVPFTISQAQSSSQINGQNVGQQFIQSNNSQIQFGQARSTQRNNNLSSFLSSNDPPKKVEAYKIINGGMQQQLGTEHAYGGGPIGQMGVIGGPEAKGFTPTSLHESRMHNGYQKIDVMLNQNGHHQQPRPGISKAVDGKHQKRVGDLVYDPQPMMPQRQRAGAFGEASLSGQLKYSEVGQRAGLQGERVVEPPFSLAASSPIPKSTGSKVLPKSSHKKKRGTIIGASAANVQRAVGTNDPYPNSQSVKTTINPNYAGALGAGGPPRDFYVVNQGTSNLGLTQKGIMQNKTATQSAKTSNNFKNHAIVNIVSSNQRMAGLTGESSVGQIKSFEQIDPSNQAEISIHSAHLTQKNSQKIGKKNFKNRGMSGVPGVTHGLNVNNLGNIGSGLTQMNGVGAISSLSGPSQRRIDKNSLGAHMQMKNKTTMQIEDVSNLNAYQGQINLLA